MVFSQTHFLLMVVYASLASHATGLQFHAIHRLAPLAKYFAGDGSIGTKLNNAVQGQRAALNLLPRQGCVQITNLSGDHVKLSLHAKATGVDVMNKLRDLDAQKFYEVGQKLLLVKGDQFLTLENLREPIFSPDQTQQVNAQNACDAGAAPVELQVLISNLSAADELVSRQFLQARRDYQEAKRLYSRRFEDESNSRKSGRPTGHIAHERKWTLDSCFETLLEIRRQHPDINFPPI